MYICTCICNLYLEPKALRLKTGGACNIAGGSEAATLGRGLKQLDLPLPAAVRGGFVIQGTKVGTPR